MQSGFFELQHQSEKNMGGRLLSIQADPAAQELPPDDFRSWLGPTVEVHLRKEYRRFQCNDCGRVDELKCFRKGISKDFIVPRPRQDLHITEEYFDVWSRRLAEEIAAEAGDNLHLFELPGDPDYVVPWPKRIIRAPRDLKISRDFEPPPPTSPFRIFDRPCGTCGRHRSMTFHTKAFLPPSDEALSAVAIDIEDYPALFSLVAWIVDERIAERLKAKKFSNVALKKKFAR